MPTTRLDIEPRVLKWARHSAGLDEATASKRIGISDSALAKWEDGTQRPTLVQLRKAARAYRRPLAVFLLTDPPNEQGFDALSDFRAPDRRRLPSPELIETFRRGLAQREVLIELHEISPGSVPEPRPLPDVSAQGSSEEIGSAIRRFLSLSMANQQRAATPGAALNLWIGAVEAAGIIVIQAGGIERNEMNGFSISEWPFPVIALNGADTPRRRLFTLTHELAHLVLNLGGLCDLHDVGVERRQHGFDVEQRCNAIGAAALLPADALTSDVLVTGRPQAYAWPLGDLEALSRKYGASSEAVLLRLVSLDRATWDTYQDRKVELDDAYERAREDERRRNRESTGGPSYYVIKARDVGHGYASSVLDAYRNDRISPLDVAEYLGIRFSQLPAFEAAV